MLLTECVRYVELCILQRWFFFDLIFGAAVAASHICISLGTSWLHRFKRVDFRLPGFQVFRMMFVVFLLVGFFNSLALFYGSYLVLAAISCLDGLLSTGSPIIVSIVFHWCCWLLMMANNGGMIRTIKQPMVFTNQQSYTQVVWACLIIEGGIANTFHYDDHRVFMDHWCVSQHSDSPLITNRPPTIEDHMPTMLHS